jgi:hypothetical protein
VGTASHLGSLALVQLAQRVRRSWSLTIVSVRRDQICMAFSAMLALGTFFAFTPLAKAQSEPMHFRLDRVQEPYCGANCPEVIVAQGVIEPDTPQTFISFVNSAAAQPEARSVVLLSSPGGQVVASMELGIALRQMGAAVVVAGQCLSACVYAMMGGVKRVIPAQSVVGIHRMSRQEQTGGGRETRALTRRFASADMVSALSEYTAQMGVDPGLIREAERISPEKIHVLTVAELRRWGLASP